MGLGGVGVWVSPIPGGGGAIQPPPQVSLSYGLSWCPPILYHCCPCPFARISSGGEDRIFLCDTQNNQRVMGIRSTLGGGGSAAPRTPTTPPPPPHRGLRPTVSCQRYRPHASMGAKGARCSMNTKGALRKILSTLHPKHYP